MTIEEVYVKLDTVLKGFPASGFDSVADSVIAELNAFADEVEKMGMKSGKQLITNLAEALNTRKSGGNSDGSVQVRLTALDFYINNLQGGATEDL